MQNDYKSIRLACILIFGWFSLQSQVVGEPPNLLKFGYNFDVHYSASTKSHFAYFYNDRGDSVSIYNAENLDSGIAIHSKGWSHGVNPVITKDHIFVFPISDNRLSMEKYSRGLELIDSIHLGIDANHAFYHEEDIILVREYPYVKDDYTVLDSVAVYRVTSGGSVLWVKKILRDYDNMGGALWTSNVCKCDSYISILHPLSNEISVVNLDSKLLSHFPIELQNDQNAKNKSWAQYMDSTYRAWGSEMKPGMIKKYLGQIMKWQKMTTLHAEQIFCDANLIGVVATEDWVSEIKYFTPTGDLLTEVLLDSATTYHFLGKHVQIGKGEYVRMQMIEFEGSFKYVPKKFKSPRYRAKEQIILKDVMFCEKCIDESYTGIIVYTARTSMNKKIERARLLRQYPSSKPVCVKSLDQQPNMNNKVITLKGDELFYFLDGLQFF